MIVVIGPVVAMEDGEQVHAAGLASRIALSAAAEGAPVEVVSRLGDDHVGDAVLVAFARAGVGHVATLRDAARATPLVPAEVDVPDPDPTSGPASVPDAGADRPAELDAQDIGLALRYLPEIRAIVLVHPAGPAVVQEAAAGAGYAGAHLVVVDRPGGPEVQAPADALVILVDEDADAVGDVVGRYAARVDGGEPPAEAYATTFASIG